jgi:hypothetical protein
VAAALVVKALIAFHMFTDYKIAPEKDRVDINAPAIQMGTAM